MNSEESTLPIRPDFLSEEELLKLHADRRFVLKHPNIFIPKIPDEMNLLEVRRIGARMAGTIERFRGRVLEADMPGLSRTYERRGVRNLGSLMLRNGDIVTPVSCIERLEEMEQGKFNIRRDAELLLKREFSLYMRQQT